MSLTQSRLKELLNYDAETGVFTWKQDRGGRRAGSRAGCEKKTYTFISVDDKSYRGHLLAWFWVHGEWPKPFLDHIDLNKHNNAIANLRIATKSQNMANRGAPKNSQTGVKGVSPYKAGASYGKPWQATIGKDGKSIHLGHFSTIADAARAYEIAAIKLHGEFGRAA